MSEIEAIFDTLDKDEADNDIVGVSDDSVVTEAIPVNETVALDDTVCTVDSEEDGVRFAVPEN